MILSASFLDKFKKKIKKINNHADLDLLRIKYLGKKGYVSCAMQDIKKIPIENRKKIGIKINFIKNFIIKKIQLCKKTIDILDKKIQLNKYKIDITLPGRCVSIGSLHPITVTINNIENYFLKLNFQIITGPEIENAYYNFDALNIPFDHPARNKKDTFWFNDKMLLRTQTSSIQVRIMEKEQPPIRIISYGKVYRNDYDSTHTPMFHQLEGLVIDKNINFSNLKWLMFNFIQNFFTKEVKIRFRSAYFPFTLPSAEIDIFIEGKNKKFKWLEVLGCGMVHPFVLNKMNIDHNCFSGFAFGIGIERITMLRYGIVDLRSFFYNDLNFIKQFT
ncbi:Phenylalanine--tRNA ligase alpha subunit [Buchnera aphidicola (Thelaxes suberi)]|uniref:phenylalanine--tRNA ligase subunit alpha n=1 Tax=Buchnera aphidicola TaxID=9 RepID=UPI003464E2F6